MTQIGPVGQGTATSVETTRSDPRREASDKPLSSSPGLTISSRWD